MADSDLPSTFNVNEFEVQTDPGRNAPETVFDSFEGDQAIEAQQELGEFGEPPNQPKSPEIGHQIITPELESFFKENNTPKEVRAQILQIEKARQVGRLQDYYQALAANLLQASQGVKDLSESAEKVGDSREGPMMGDLDFKKKRLIYEDTSFPIFNEFAEAAKSDISLEQQIKDLEALLAQKSAEIRKLKREKEELQGGFKKGKKEDEDLKRQKAEVVYEKQQLERELTEKLLFVEKFFDDFSSMLTDGRTDGPS